MFGDTLLSEFSDDEIETILAHELGHHVNKDIPVGILISNVITLGELYLAHLALLWGVNFFGFEGVWDIAALSLYMLVMGAYGLVTMPLSKAYGAEIQRALARAAGGRVCVEGDRDGAGLCLRPGAAGQPEPGGRRP